MNAVIYVRYSSDNQREDSIEGQVRECTAFAERKGYYGEDYFLPKNGCYHMFRNNEIYETYKEARQFVVLFQKLKKLILIHSEFS